MIYHGSASQLLHILVAQIESWKVSSLASLWPYENTAIVAAFKVSLALDGPVVLARGLIEGDANPKADTGDLGHCANIGYGAPTSVRFGEKTYATRE
jgi:hypothetical protein